MRIEKRGMVVSFSIWYLNQIQDNEKGQTKNKKNKR